MLKQITWLLPLVVLVGAGLATASAADHEHSADEFELFWAAEALRGTGQNRAGDADPWFDADALFGLSEHQFRVLGEYYVTPDEHELERFQVGYQFAPETTLWIGRFHQPASNWNSEHHHGRYLQTAITRPFIERWEYEQGVIPQHITGALFDTRQAVADHALQLSTGVGYGPAIQEHELQPIDLLGSNPGRHRLSVSGRLAFLPQYDSGNSAGLVFARDQVQTAAAPVIDFLNSAHITLTVYGGYLDWSVEPWRVIAADYYVDIALDATARDESFITGYVQAERTLPLNLTAFGRIEDSSRMQESRYVAMFNDHDGEIDVASQREAIGLRWDFLRRQALTIELSHVVSFYKKSNEARLQWSGVIP